MHTEQALPMQGARQAGLTQYLQTLPSSGSHGKLWKATCSPSSQSFPGRGGFQIPNLYDREVRMTTLSEC